MAAMYFFKKFIGTLLMPLPLGLALLAAALVLLGLTRRQRLGRWLALASLLLLFLTSSHWVAWHFDHFLTVRYPPWRVSAHSLKNAPSVVVVLGGGSINDARLPPVAQLSLVSLDRLIEGIRLYRALAPVNPQARLVLSGGGKPAGSGDAGIMRQVALSLGIPGSAMRLETRSLDTASQARRLKPMLGTHPFLLVTSAVHMPRAIALFQAQGLHPIAAPSDRLGLGMAPRWQAWQPDPANLNDFTAAWHEILGRAWAGLRGETR